MKRMRLTLLLLFTGFLPAWGEAQDRPSLEIERAEGVSTRTAVDLARGYAAVRLSLLQELGWAVSEEEGAIVLSAAREITITMRLDSPFFRWDGVVLQMADVPYRAGNQTFIPLQFLTDFLPRRLPGLYEFVGERSLLRAGDLDLLREMMIEDQTPEIARIRASTAGPIATEPSSPAPPATGSVNVESAAPSTYDGVRLVVIDPGHGGADPGALGPDGIREKTVALAIGLKLAERLRGLPKLEVLLLRDDDTFVDVWARGQIATDAKGERPGIFVSIHANSFPARREASGFETYFLSDARTEHERRVSAIENASLSMSGQNVNPEQMQDIDFILRDLKNYEHAHWSENLASLIQDEIADFHPGPNRGVKQGVLAVLTNALMPSVLVEVGYLSNTEEGRLLGEEAFHQDTADAISEAIVRFFDRYPPGAGGGGSREDR